MGLWPGLLLSSLTFFLPADAVVMYNLPTEWSESWAQEQKLAQDTGMLTDPETICWAPFLWEAVNLEFNVYFWVLIMHHNYQRLLTTHKIHSSFLLCIKYTIISRLPCSWCGHTKVRVNEMRATWCEPSQGPVHKTSCTCFSILCSPSDGCLDML